MTTRFGHHADPVIDFCKEVDELGAMAFDRRAYGLPVPDLEDRIRKAVGFVVPEYDLQALLARAALRELEAEFCRGDVMARRRAIARDDRMKQQFETASWLN